MIGIESLAKEIKYSLKSKNADEMIMDSYLLGFLQGKNHNKNNFAQNLELIKNLREFIEIQVYTNEQILNLYNRALNANQDLLQLCNNIEENTFKIEQFNENQFQPIKCQVIQNNQQQQNSNQQNFQIFEDEEEKNFQFAQRIQLELDTQYLKEVNTQIQMEDMIRKKKKQQEDEQKNQIECKICLEVIPFIEMATLQCSHIYHQKCLNQYCVTQIQARQFPLCCPTIECKKPMIYSDLTEVLDDQNLYEFQQFTFKQYVESHGDEYSWCPTPDCKYVFIADDAQFNCPSCTKSYCLHCKIEYHHGQTCQAYKEKIQNELRQKNEKILDDQFFQFVQGAKYKQCPQCKFWVEKNQGCNHMTCRCKFQFCYVCGGVYGRCHCR
ncbi:unnamed protein product [Paramecium primaurelia]|uniref:RBR-type E3 ubiquitin transferase n=1 Tax=Paramecium primaurelia TaxID=5886 RepID=A0A8S1QDI2_PARPR|nr:unnamed protein product [Paramecium primaurelia]